MRVTRRHKRIGLLAVVAAGIALVLISTLAGRSTEEDKGIVASLLSRALSTEAARVSIGDVRGALSSDMTLRDVSIADRDGVWLEVDRVRLVWRRTALLERKLEIERLELGTVTAHRQPVPSEPAASGQPSQDAANEDQPLLPELPLRVEIKDFRLREAVLAEPLLGVPARLSASGSASLGYPAEGLDLRFDATRQDAPGHVAARLALVPQTERLDLTLSVEEPAGGLLVHALKLPDLPPLELDISGSGTLDAFAARLAFEAGDRIGATGTAALQRETAGRRLALDLDARVEGLLPAPLAPVFAGTTRLDGAVLFADSGAIELPSLAIVSQTARLEAHGALAPDHVAAFRITARAVPNSGTATSAGGAEIGRLVLDAEITGPLTGPAIEATLEADEVAAAQGRVGRVRARFLAAPAHDGGADATSIPFSASLQADGVSLSDTALTRAIGPSLSLTASGTVRDRIADVDAARLQTTTAELRFAGRVGQPLLQGRLTVDAPDLSHFGAMTSLALRGRLDLTAELSGVPAEGRIEAALKGGVGDVAIGNALADGLLGGRLDVTGTVRRLSRGGFGFGDLRLTGAHVAARAEGEATTDRMNIDAHVVIPELARGDARLSGRAAAAAQLRGTSARPDVSATLTITDARALERPIPRLVLQADASDVTGMLDARARLSGSVDGKPAEGTVHLARRSPDGWRLDDLDLRIGTVSLQGDISIDPAYLAEGQVVIDAPDLDVLSPLALTKLSGRLRAAATLTTSAGAQNGMLSADADDLKIGAATLDRLTALVRFSDLYRRPALDGEVALDRGRIGDEEISQVRLAARGTPEASEVTFAAQARSFAIDARGRLVSGDPVRLELAALTAQRGPHRINLLRPATLALADGGVDVRALRLSLERGRLDVDGRVGATLDVSVTAQGVPLSLAETMMPGLSGTLSADAKIAGPSASPTGTWRARIDKLVIPQTRDAGLPPLEIAASGRLAEGRTSLDATVRASAASTMRVAGTVPLGDEGLDVTMRGRVDLGLANGALSAAGRRLAGQATLDMRAHGSLAAPKLEGAATLAGASFTDELLGVRLSGMTGRLSAGGDSLQIERLTAQTPNGGTLAAHGDIKIDPHAGFPGTVQISGQRVALVSNDTVNAVASLSLTMTGALAREPKVSGRVDVVSLEVTIPERLPANVGPLEGTRQIAPPPTAAARLAEGAKARARAQRAPAFDAELDLAISAPSRVFLRGRGVDAELGGDIRLQGRLSDPLTVGAFELRRGRMSVAGTRLDFTRGRIAFTGHLTPDLDLAAQTRAGDVTATVAITGPATQPSFLFTSEPDLPQEEVLSRILFSKASGGLSAIQAVQLAQAAAQFSGGGGGGDMFERVRRSLGVDSLDVSVGAGGNANVGISRAINQRISVGVKAGTEPKDSAVSLDIDVTRNLRLQGEVNREGGTAVGVGMEWEY